MLHTYVSFPGAFFMALWYSGNLKQHNAFISFQRDAEFPKPISKI